MNLLLVLALSSPLADPSTFQVVNRTRGPGIAVVNKTTTSDPNCVNGRCNLPSQQESGPKIVYGIGGQPLTVFNPYATGTVCANGSCNKKSRLRR